MRRIQSRQGGSRAGVSLVMVAFTVSILATLSVSMMMVSNSVTKEKMAERKEVAALFAAETGISEAVFQLNTKNPGIVGSPSQPKVHNGSVYWVTEQDLPGGMKSLVSTGIDNGAGVRVELTVQQDQNSIWVWGAFGDEELKLDSNSHVDSYDSTLGSYASQQTNGSGSGAWAKDNGHVGSNGNVSLLQNSEVRGNAIPGPTSTTTVSGNATVSGSTAPNSGTVSIPTLTMPSFGSLGDYSTGNGNSVTIPSGDHEYDTFAVNKNADLTIVGPAKLVVTNFTLESNSQMWIDATNGPVEIYVWDDFVLNSNTILAPTTYTPADLMVNLNSDNIINPTQNVQLAEVSFESNSQLYATLFAPNAMVDIDSNFELFGAVVAKQVNLNSWSRTHFDEALLQVNNQNANAAWKAFCWRKVGFKPAKNANYP